MSECLFCKIVARAIPAAIVFEDEQVLAFEDIHPQAPVHVLVIPKRHVPSLAHEDGKNQALLGHLLMASASIARTKGIAERGYRLVANTGSEGGQTVHHLHLHLLGGRHMTWPPG